MRLLVVGAGSIGRRHLCNAMGLRWEVAAVRGADATALKDMPGPVASFHSLSEAIRTFRPEGAIVATPSSLHLDSAAELAAANVATLIEKPLCSSLETAVRFRDEHPRAERIGIGSNLRFWPVIHAIKANLPAAGRVLSVRVQAGQHLSQWRPGTDYHTSYSADSARGGGVLLDLIHEIDYLLWFFGAPQEVFGALGRTGSLGITAEDLAVGVLRWSSGMVAELHLDYLRHRRRRACEVVGGTATISWDMDQGKVECWRAADDVSVVADGAGYDTNRSYVDELLNLQAVAEGRGAFMTSLDEGIQALRVVDAIKRSSESGRWAAL